MHDASDLPALVPSLRDLDNIIGVVLVNLDRSVYTIDRRALGNFVIWRIEKNGTLLGEFTHGPVGTESWQWQLSSRPPDDQSLLDDWKSIKRSVENGINYWNASAKERLKHSKAAEQSSTVPGTVIDEPWNIIENAKGREVVRMYCYEDQTAVEIGGLLGLSPKRIYGIVDAARKRYTQAVVPTRAVTRMKRRGKAG